MCPRRPGLFSETAEEQAHVPVTTRRRSTTAGATPAIQVKAALQRKRVTLAGRAFPLSSPAQTERAMSEPRAVSQGIGQHLKRHSTHLREK